jgi:3D (Asp-Asp-Asp) domain-containing protein
VVYATLPLSEAAKAVFCFMPFLVTALVSFLVLPASVVAPNPALAAYPKNIQPPKVLSKAIPDTKKNQTVFTVKLTAYNALPEQTDNNPFTTASGAFSNPEVVAARSNDLGKALPFGTIIAIERDFADTPMCNYKKVEHLIGYRVIADSMNTRITNTIDVLLNENDTVSIEGRELNPGIALGMCSKVTTRIVGYVSISNIPSTQEGLVRLIDSGEIAKR